MVEVLDACDALDRLGDPFVGRPAWRPRTHFETRGARKGHRIFDLLYRRRPRRR
jgi:tRNA (guanine-N7-)-methyltransferase